MIHYTSPVLEAHKWWKFITQTAMNEATATQKALGGMQTARE
jgi:hypothetical protein